MTEKTDPRLEVLRDLETAELRLPQPPREPRDPSADEDDEPRPPAEGHEQVHIFNAIRGCA